ncbi:radical SAM protein [bacterium]|nr:radical SAM protein [bacterium]
MLRFRNENIILTDACNLCCKYCCRDTAGESNLAFTEEMKDYLRNLSPAWCDSVIADGGEPLLCWDKVKELFSYVPAGIRKTSMSNCKLLTHEKFYYINANDIVLRISHDGPATKYLRGIDVLDKPALRDLIQQVKYIHCFSVITKHNTNVWENFFDTAKKLGRINFEYDTFPVSDKFAYPEGKNLIEGFDYEEWITTYTQFKKSPYSRYRFPWTTKQKAQKKTIAGIIRPGGFLVKPNGRVCGCMSTAADYGSVIHTNDFVDCCRSLIRTGVLDDCIVSSCKYKDVCCNNTQFVSEHICKCRRLMWEALG